MFDRNNRQYMFKQSSGSIVNFYFDEKSGLCRSFLAKSGSWSKPLLIQKDASPSFFACMDKNDGFDILFQDKKGNIFYLKAEEEKLNTFPVLNSKSPTPYNKYLHIISAEDNLHFFYVLKYEESSILAHQTLSDGNIKAPRVIDYVNRNDCPYSVCKDKEDNIFVFFQLSDGKNLQIGSRKYLTGREGWGDFTPVTRHNGNCEFPSAAVDGSNTIHICYHRHSPRQYEIVFQQSIPKKNMWTGEVIVASSAYPFEEPSIILLDTKMVIFWVRDSLIYCSYSENGGQMWSKAAKYDFFQGKQLFCMSYASNVLREKEKLIASHIPGSFANGLTLAFYKEALSSPEDLSAKDLKDMIVDSLTLLKGHVEELKSEETKLKSEVSDLIKTNQSIERELVKLSIRLGMTESGLNEIKRSGNMAEKMLADTLAIRKEIEHIKCILKPKRYRSGKKQDTPAD